MQFGALVGLAAVAALLASFPAMIRVSAALAGGAPAAQVRAWAALGAAAIGPMALTIVVLRGARQGLRSFGEPQAPLRIFGLGLWLAMLFITLALFGGALRATTHHRALAGVTFGCGALVLALGWGLVCVRLVEMLRGMTERARQMAMLLLGGAALAAIAVLVLRFLRAVSGDASSSEAAATVVDVLAFVLTALLASQDWSPVRRPLALVGPPLAVFLAALGIRTLLDPPVRQAIAERAPAYVSGADLVSGQW
jgi:hypothetical protein